MIYIVEEFDEEKFRYNAGSKARDDVEQILKSLGAEELKVTVSHNEDRKQAGKIKSLYYHYSIAGDWSGSFDKVQAGDTVVFQFPVKAHTILFSKVLRKLHRKSVQTIALIHDLECLRNVFYWETTKSMGYRLKMEEVSALKEFGKIIAHNARMKAFLTDQIGIEKQKIVELEIFDYLIPEYHPEQMKRDRQSVIVAGNLDPEKAAYAYLLPDGCRFELYGANFAEDRNINAQYMGKYLPEELPYRMQGGFGLVWDGPEAKTCSGLFGNYLKYNNPHKTSLYLASGIPVIIWEEAAIADYIRSQQCGITVRSLDEIPEKLKAITDEEYYNMYQHAAEAGKKLRDGYYTIRAFKACGLPV